MIAKALLDKGDDLCGEGDADAAIAAYDEAIAASRGDGEPGVQKLAARAMWAKGVALGEKGDSDAAIKGLAKLKLRGTRYSGKGLASLAALPNLAELHLNAAGLNENELFRLADFPALTKLILDFGAGERGQAAYRLSFLKDVKKLTSLAIMMNTNAFGETMLDGIAAARGLTDLAFTALRGGAWLGVLKRLPALEALTLFFCDAWRDADVACLADLASLRRLSLVRPLITIKMLLNLRSLPLEKIFLRLADELYCCLPEMDKPRFWGRIWTERELTAIRLAWPDAKIV